MFSNSGSQLPIDISLSPLCCGFLSVALCILPPPHPLFHSTSFSYFIISIQSHTRDKDSLLPTFNWFLIVSILFFCSGSNKKSAIFLSSEGILWNKWFPFSGTFQHTSCSAESFLLLRLSFIIQNSQHQTYLYRTWECSYKRCFLKSTKPGWGEEKLFFSVSFVTYQSLSSWATDTVVGVEDNPSASCIPITICTCVICVSAPLTPTNPF